ncbi:hypothetical protein [Niveispirillum irakense]|uniref:hypothetical protein n=1 Tax=Niveispirillum irakense TaxID=34011 RepID=UPI0003F9ED34|nr:hypothetical protein [Niveispirillum irakense]
MSVSLPSRLLLCLCLAAGAGTAQASVQNQPTTPTGPTMGDIVRQATQPAAPAAAGPALPAANLPTMGDIVKQTEGQAKAAAPAAGSNGCTRPKPPGTLPDGTKATDEEMRKAQVTVKTYVTESEAFNACLDKLVQANIAKLSVHDYLSLTAQHDLTISAMQLFADRFNQQLRAYKAKSAPAAKP